MSFEFVFDYFDAVVIHVQQHRHRSQNIQFYHRIVGSARNNYHTLYYGRHFFDYNGRAVGKNDFRYAA